MHEISTGEGFVEISKNMGDMMRFVANEPSAGLFFIQQHTQKAVPKLVKLKKTIDKESHETSLHTEDMEESIGMIGSMKECGFLIADEMIKEIKNSLSIISTKQPKKGLLSSAPWSPSNWGRNVVYSEQDVEKSSGYISGVFKSAKRTAGNFKWSQASLEPHNSTSSSTLPEDLSMSGEPNGEICEVSKTEKLMSMYESFDEFRADKEAKLEEWLGGGNSKCDDNEREMQALGHQIFMNLG